MLRKHTSLSSHWFCTEWVVLRPSRWVSADTVPPQAEPRGACLPGPFLFSDQEPRNHPRAWTRLKPERAWCRQLPPPESVVGQTPKPFFSALLVGQGALILCLWVLLYFLWSLAFLMFQIIKVIYAQRGKFTMSIKLQRAGDEQAANQHECLMHLRKMFL